MESRAFTLIELLVVVLIIGILAAIALPQYQKAVAKTRFMSMVSILRSLAEAKKVYYLANGTSARSFDVLDVQLPTDCGIPETNKYYGEVAGCDGYAIYLDSALDHSISATFSKKNSSSCSVRVYFLTSPTNACYVYGDNRCDYLCQSLSNTPPTTYNDNTRRYTF